MVFDGSNGLTMQTWTTTSRPASPVIGQTGFNTTYNGQEVYNGSAWTLMNGGPAFSAYPSGSFSASASTWTIIPANTKEFDTNSNYNNTGSTVGNTPAYSFLPTVPGYYQVNGTWSLGAGSTFTRSLCAIYKNGSLFKQGLDTTTTTATGSTVSALLYLNGTTDYISFYLYETGSGTNTVNAGPGSTYFQANFVRGQ